MDGQDIQDNFGPSQPGQSGTTALPFTRKRRSFLPSPVATGEGSGMGWHVQFFENYAAEEDISASGSIISTTS